MSKDSKLTLALMGIIILLCWALIIRYQAQMNKPQALSDEEAAVYYRCVNQGNTSEYCLLRK